MIKANVCKIQTLIQPFIQGDFDLELQKFELKMMGQVLNALGPFLTFSKSYIAAKTHNMLAIMLDFCFKTMKVIWDFLGNSLALQIVAKYNVKIVYPLLVQAYFHLNLMKAIAELIVVEDDDNFFDKNISNDDAIMLRNKLHMFYQLSVGLVEINNPLQWWANHAMQFPHVFFGSSNVRDCGVSNRNRTNFQCYWHYNKSLTSRLGIDNFDHLVLVIKNWLNDAYVGCDGGKAKICMNTYKLNKS